MTVCGTSPVKSRSRTGLTLVELVVSLAVTGLALAAGYGVLGMIVDLRQSAGDVDEQAIRAAVIRDEIRSWIAGARLTTDPGGPSFRGLDGVKEERPDDSLVFLTAAPTPLGARETIVRLFVDRSEETPERGLVAEFLEWPEGERTMIEIELRVAGLETGYLSRVTGERRSLPSWISSTVLPEVVELRLIPEQGDSLSPLLALPIVVPIAGGR